MVYNPLKEKPVKYYANFFSAFFGARRINQKEKEDVLILKVVGKIENNKIRIIEDEVNKCNSIF
jgi:hypothetical protein